MTTELWYLFLTSILLAVMWVPYVVGQAQHAGLPTPKDYQELREPGQFPAWVRRANRAHVNLVEQFGAFAGLIIIAHIAGVSNSTTAFAAGVFFWARLVHAIVFIAGVTWLKARTVFFTVAFLALLVLAWQILANAGAPAA